MSFLRNREVTYLEEIKYRLKDYAQLPRRTYYLIRRLIDYAPILWDDWDWDYSAFLRLIEFKLKRMRKCIVKNDIIVAAPRVGKQIAYAEFLLERIQKDDYFPELQAKLEEEFGELDMSFIPCDDMPGCSQAIFSSSKCKTKAENERASEARMQLYYKQEAEKQKDYDRLFRHIRKYIQHWWD